MQVAQARAQAEWVAAATRSHAQPRRLALRGTAIRGVHRFHQRRLTGLACVACCADEPMKAEAAKPRSPSRWTGPG